MRILLLTHAFNGLTRAIPRNEAQGGVIVLQAEVKLDAGPVRAAVNFPMRPASKARGWPSTPITGT